MKKLLFIHTCAILTGLSFQSCTKTDAQIHTDVQKVLSAQYPMVSSTVDKGVVTLTGTVDSEATRTSAEGVVKTVKDVKSVTNNIMVKEAAPAVVINPDQTISSTINSAMMAAGYKDVKVEVINGEVTLTGNVKRSDLTKVMQIANESNPKKVINKLNLK